MGLGHDVWYLHIDNIFRFFEVINTQDITIFNFEKLEDDMFRFNSKVIERRRISNLEFELELVATHGLLGGIVTIFTNITTIVGLISFIGTCYFLSLFVWKIEVVGTNEILNEKIEMLLVDYDINRFSLVKSQSDLEPIQARMNFDLRNEVEFIYIERKGLSYTITYNKKITDEVEKNEYDNLYATKSGVIKKIDISSGKVVVNDNDFVKAGDLLVENYIVDTRENMHVIPVKGAIFAYTWYVFEASLPAKNLEYGIPWEESAIFNDLLQATRESVNNNINYDGEYIHDEKIMSFERKGDRMVLKIHFTLIEDITKN